MTATPRPFLAARGSHLILAPCRVDPDTLVPLLPPGCRLDISGGDGLVSLVAFDFSETRVFGVRWPGFVNFPEVNLRFYVRRGRDCDAGSTERRGVVFVREFVPRRFVAALARWACNEPYQAVRMQSRAAEDNDVLVVEHQLQIAGRTRTVRARAETARYRPPADSTEAFLIGHQWGFGTSRRGRLIRHQVVHEPWDVHRVRSFDLDWDWAAAYGPRFAALQRAEPASVVLAAGSAVSVFPGGRIDAAHPSPTAVATSGVVNPEPTP